MIDMEGAVVLRGFCDAIEDHIITRALTGLVERAATGFEEGDDWLYFSARASSPDGDMDGYVIEGENIVTEAYDGNPVILFSHDRNLGIGLVDEHARDQNGMRIKRGRIDLLDPFSAEKANQVRRGILRGVSIGVRPLDDPKYKEGKLYFGKVQLVENSLTHVPANVRALIGKEARELWQAAAGGSRSANYDLTEKIANEIIERQRGMLDKHLEAKLAEFDKHVGRELERIEIRAAEAVEKRIGSVASLLERAQAQEMAAALRSVMPPPASRLSESAPELSHEDDGSNLTGVIIGKDRTISGDAMSAASTRDEDELLASWRAVIGAD
jgi:HK97 family phage prohead protease